MHAPSRLHFSANGTDHINLRCDDPTCNHALIADALGVSVEQLLAVPVSAASDNHAEAGGAAPHLAAEDIENAAVEALLEQYANEQNVWEYLDTIQHRMRVPPAQRQRFYEQFKALVATRPQESAPAEAPRAERLAT